MNKTTIVVDKFDIVKFINDAFDKNMDIVTFPYAVHWGQLKNFLGARFLSVEGVDPKEAMDISFKIEDTLNYLKNNEDNYVYVNFSSVDIGEPVICIDGNEYGYEYNDEDDDCEEETGITDTSTVGYIIQYRNGNYEINSGIYEVGGGCCGGPFWGQDIEVREDCTMFNKALEDYLKNYIG